MKNSNGLAGLVRGPVVIVVVLALALAVLRGLVGLNLTDYVVPPPEQVGQLFFTSLKAHNYAAAHRDLRETLAQNFTPDDLRRINERLEAATPGIEQANGESADIHDRSATAEVVLRMNDGQKQTLSVPLEQGDDGLWTITSLAPLEALIGP
jgi:hypothetical protein